MNPNLENPLVSIVVVNWNGERFLQRCLDSLLTQTFTGFEIIVVDNGSSDGSVALLDRLYLDKIILVKNAGNLGFSGGNNCGIMRSRGEFIATLNADAYADSHWLDEMVAVARGEGRIGMVGSKIFLLNEQRSLDSVGVNIYPDGMSKQRGHLEPDSNRYSQVEEILVPSACAALYRRTMLNEIGLFDEDFFAYCEDTDLGLRGRLRGWIAVLAPLAIVHHQYSGAFGKVSPLKAYYVERNHVWVAIKTLPMSMLVFVPVFTVYRLAGQCWNMLWYSAGKSRNNGGKLGKSSIAFAVIRAYISAIGGLPAVIRKRREIRAKNAVSDREIRSWFKHFGLQLRQLFLDP